MHLRYGLFIILFLLFSLAGSGKDSYARVKISIQTNDKKEDSLIRKIPEGMSLSSFVSGIILSDSTLKAAIFRNGGSASEKAVSDFRSNLTIIGPTSENILQIDYHHSNKEQAIRWLDTLADVFLENYVAYRETFIRQKLKSNANERALIEASFRNDQDRWLPLIQKRLLSPIPALESRSTVLEHIRISCNNAKSLLDNFDEEKWNEQLATAYYEDDTLYDLMREYSFTNYVFMEPVLEGEIPDTIQRAKEKQKQEKNNARKQSELKQVIIARIDKKLLEVDNMEIKLKQDLEAAYKKFSIDELKKMEEDKQLSKRWDEMNTEDGLLNKTLEKMINPFIMVEGTQYFQE